MISCLRSISGETTVKLSQTGGQNHGGPSEDHMKKNSLFALFIDVVHFVPAGGAEEASDELAPEVT